MKKILQISLFALVCLGITGAAFGQYNPYAPLPPNQPITQQFPGAGSSGASVNVGPLYTFPKVTATGQIAPYLSFVKTTPPYAYPPKQFTIDFSNAGTAASACTYSVQGSSDAVHWYTLQSSATCIGTGFVNLTNGPVAFLAINILTYTAGDGTTAVTFRFTNGGGLNGPAY